jgi:hypothetical protein
LQRKKLIKIEKEENTMGCYVNPKGETKEHWLLKKGITVTSKEARDLLREELKNKDISVLPVILVNNGPFTAAAIAYSEKELEEFLRPEDLRKKWIYIVALEDLKEVSPIEEYLK